MAARILNIVVGLGLLAAPQVLGYEGLARVNHLILGPIAASFAVIAISEVLRELRWVNLLIGGWLVLSPLLIPHDQVALAVGVTAGMVMAALSVVRGPRKSRLGGGWWAVLDPDRSEGGSDEQAK